MSDQSSFRARFFSNPLALVLAIALGLALYGSYQRGKELTIVCRLMPMPLSVNITKPRNDAERAIRICHDRMTADDTRSDP